MAEHIQCRVCDSPYCDGCNNYILSKMLHNGKFDCIMDDYRTIKLSADVAEVKHGEWISHEGYEECGECHTKAIYPHNYCPNCGAKMDGKVD